MTDEELFKAWKSEQYKDQSTEEKMEFVEHLHTFPKYFEQAFLAGLKAGRPQWHDLRKDKNDLPKATTPVLVILESGVPYVSWISSDKGWWFCTNYYTGEDKVIAWCEIPTFDKE